MLGWGGGSPACPTFILLWLPAKLDFWSQAQVYLKGLAITVITIHNNNSLHLFSACSLR